MRTYISLCLLGLAMFPVASEATPISVNCPNSASTADREFILTTEPSEATCLLSGNESNTLKGDNSDLAGWTFIDKGSKSSDPDNEFFIDILSAMSGSFTIDESLWSAFDRIAIGLVVGGGATDPKWAVFELPKDEVSGSWAQTVQQGHGLSHAFLYGMGSPAIAEVPEPASLLLLGTGLTFVARRRRAKR